MGLRLKDGDVVETSRETRAAVSPVEREEKQLEAGTSVKSEWMWMLLQLDQIPTYHNVIAAASAWIILAAYLVLPGTFTTLTSSEATGQAPQGDDSKLDGLAHAITTGIAHLGLAVLSATLASAGALGCLVMWAVHRKNYLWLCMKIFTPIILNSFAGLISTLVNVYTAKKGVWSITARVNAIVSGSVAGFACLCYYFYYFVLLNDVKIEHDKEYAARRGNRADYTSRKATRHRMRNRFG